MKEEERDMTEEELENTIVTHGTDMANWPEGLRADAARFAETDTGKAAFSEMQALDKMMMQAKQELLQSEGADMFLAQLKAIPDEFSQKQTVIAVTGTTSWTVGAFIDRIFDPVRLWSPAGLFSQGVFASVLLFAGLMVGVNAAGTESFEDYDISAGLFEGSDQDYSIDG